MVTGVRFVWWLSVVILITAGAGFSFARAALEHRMLEQTRQRQSLHSQRTRSQHRPAWNVLSPQYLGDRAQIDALAADLHTLAVEQGLAVADATYTEGSSAGEAKRMDINVHLRGGYPAMKKVVAQLMQDYPSLALEMVSAQRQRTMDTVLEIDLRLAFFYRKA